MAWKTPAQKKEPKSPAPKQARSDESFPGLTADPNGATQATQRPAAAKPLTKFDKIQQDEVMVLQSIYGDDFVLHQAKQSVWQKSQPSFDVTIKASSDGDFWVKLGVVLVASYPKSPPLLTVERSAALREATAFKVQKYIETQPELFAVEEQEMIDRIVEGIREILEDAAQAKAQGLELPSLEEERAAHEQVMAQMAQLQKDEEERKRQQESREEERVLGDMLQEELKRQKARAKESRLKSRTGQGSGDTADAADDEEDTPLIFDQPCKLLDRAGNAIFFTSVRGKTLFRSGPVTQVYKVKPVLAARQQRPGLVLKQADISADGKDASVFKRQLHSLEAQLESLKGLRHPNILEVLDYRIDRALANESSSTNSSAASWSISVLALLAERGPLNELLDLAGCIDVSKIRPWTSDLLGGLGFLHNHGIVHQDIHPGNVLLVRENSGEIIPKLADAGFQRDLHNITTKVQVLPSTSGSKSAYWFAPEIAGVLRPQYTQKTDIWDLGVVFLQMLFGQHVTQKYQSPSALMNSMSLSDALHELLGSFFRSDSKKRPRSFDLSSSEFLATDAPILANETSLTRYPSAQTYVRSRRDSNSHTSLPLAQRSIASRYLEDYVEEGRLGKGGFGEVVKARKKLDNQIYAIKKITQKSQATLSEILKEVRLLSQLSHPAVVRYYNTWLEEIPDTSTQTDDSSTDRLTRTDDSQGTISQDMAVEPSTGALDFMSSSGFPQVEFGYSSDSGDSLDGNEEDAGEGSSSDEDDSSDKLHEPQRGDDDDPAHHHRRRRPSQRPFQTVLYIAMEYCEKRTLRDLISRNPPISKNTTEMWRVTRQILEGLVHIHALGIVHRDLKPENIFLSTGADGDNVKIGDFGLATSGSIVNANQRPEGAAALDAEDMTRSVGTSIYVAPEVRSGGTGSYTAKVDMYSLGVMIFEMNYPPMMGMQRARVMDALRTPDVILPADFESHGGERTDQKTIILSLLTHSPKDRPSSAELLKSGQLPMEMESDSIRRALAGIADPASQYYDKMLETLFARQVEPAKDLAWDMTPQLSSNLMDRQLTKQVLISIFRRHGAVESPTGKTMLYPRATRYSARSANVVELLNRNGMVLQLPYDLVTGHARVLAKQPGGPATNDLMIKGGTNHSTVKRMTGSSAGNSTLYSFGEVFRDRKDGGQPFIFGEVDFDIITAYALDLALKEAEVLKVIDEIIAAFPSLSSKLMCFHLGHSDLLDVIFDFCGVEAGARKAAAEVLSKLNIRSFTWQKLRGELRSPLVGVSATSVDELSRFDFRDTPSKAFAKLKTLFEGSDSFQKAAPTIAHLKEVYEYTKRFGITTKVYVMPLLSLNEAIFPGGVIFSCLYDKKVKDVFAAGGRYDGLIREHRPKIGGRIEERYAVGFALAWEKQLAAQVNRHSLDNQASATRHALPVGKASSKKAEEKVQGLFGAKRSDVLVASFDPAILRSAGLEILQLLWAHDISAELARDARSPEELLSPDHCWIVIIKPDNVLKVKTLIRKDAPDVDMQTSQLINWLRSEFRERDARSQATSRAIAGSADVPTLAGGLADKSREQQVRVLIAQTKSKKFNRQTVVEQAQVSASKLVRSFLDGPIAAIETTDQVMHLIRDTALSEPESWRKVEHTVGTSEKKYVREIQEMLDAWRSEYQTGAQDRHAFVYNFRTGNCIYYDLGA